MNTLKTAAARFTRLAPQGQTRWLKLAVYALVFLLPFGMAIIALLVYLDGRNRAAGRAKPASLPSSLPAQAPEKGDVSARGTVKTASGAASVCLSTYCSNPH
jgi:hypothetical protein